MALCNELGDGPEGLTRLMRRALVLVALVAVHLAAPIPALADETQGDDGVTVEVTYTAEAFTGAGRDRIDYVDNLDLILDARRGSTGFHLYALYNNGRDFSGPRFPRGYVASNIETGVKALRLYEAWIEQEFAGGRASLRAGLYDLNSEFDALDASSLFINPAHGIGTDFSQSGANGPSIFPVTSLAARLQMRASDTLMLRAAILDGVPGDPARPKRTAIKLGSGDGMLMVAETEKAVGRWRLIAGYWHYTAKFEDGLASEISGTATLRRGNNGYYLRGEGPVSGEINGRGTNVFFRLGRADDRFNEVRDFASSGIHFRGPLKRRAEDEAGLAIAWAGSSGRARALQQQLGRPIARNEWAFEATYFLKLNDWLTLQPDLQYQINPAFERGRRAWVAGLRVTIGWTPIS